MEGAFIKFDNFRRKGNGYGTVGTQLLSSAFSVSNGLVYSTV